MKGNTLGDSGRNNSKSSIGSSGHTGCTRPGQTEGNQRT